MQLRLCGQIVIEAKLIKNILSTFPHVIAILSQQYRNMKFMKHSSMMFHLLLAEKHHQLLLRNVGSCHAREVYIIVAMYTDYGGPCVHVGAVTPGDLFNLLPLGTMLLQRCMLLKPLEDHQEVLLKKSQPKPHRQM